MNYFTPQLYVEFNSDDPTAATVEKRDDVLLPTYVLAEELLLSAPDQDVFSEIAVHPLYNEVDATDRGVFSHDILLRNGRVRSVKFVAFDILTVSKDAFDMSRPDRIPAVVT